MRGPRRQFWNGSRVENRAAPSTFKVGQRNMTTKETTVQFRGQSIKLPAGLRVKPVTPYPTQARPQFWLDEFPEAIFPANSITRHDAVHYGVWLEENEVQP